jgi:predicted phosphate transport protein (TIGR00153 family)
MAVFDWNEESPFEPLGRHMDQVRACVDLVLPIFECVRRQDYDELKRLSEQVFKAEHEADKIKDEIRRTIPKAFSLPVYRGDLLAYLHIQDDIADSVEDLAFQLMIKKLRMPEPLAEDIFGYVRQVLHVCELLVQATDQLKELAEEDFGGPRAENVLEKVGQADQGEWEADKLQFHLAQRLFAMEDELKATDIFLWSGIFQNLGALANHADKTGERLRRMLAR